MARQPRRVSGGLPAPAVPPSVTFRIPENFSAFDTLPPELSRYIDHTHYILHTILTQQAGWRLGLDDWVYLNVSKLREVIPQRAIGPLLDCLKGAGVVETDNHYRPGLKARGYRLCREYHTPLIDIPCESVKLAGKVVGSAEEERSNATLPVHHHLIRHLRTITIDRGEAERILEDAPSEDGVWEGECRRLALRSVTDGDWRFRVDGCGRCHTHITNLPRELRPALRVGGERVVCVDVANCQPLLLSLLLLQPQLPNHSNPGAEGLGGDAGSLSNLWDPFSYDVHFSPTIRTDLQPDEAEFVRLCQSGTLYDCLQELPDLRGMSRDRLKRRYMTDVTCGKRHYVTPLTTAFRTRFPAVWELVQRWKQDDHGSLARLLLRYESSLIVGRVCRRLMEERPEMFVATIHDSLLVRPGDVATARRVMEEEFVKVGARPRLREEDHTA